MILKKKSFLAAIAIALAMFSSTSVCAFADETNDDYLHTDGNKILDENNNQVRLTGISWFGYETTEGVFHGLWKRSFEQMIDTIADKGFNIVRIPLSVQLVKQWSEGVTTDARGVDFNTYPELKGLGGEQILDKALEYCKKKGVKVMFDMHRVYNGDQSPVWHDKGFTKEDFENAWVYLARKYKNDDTVIACDLFNEPRGKAYKAETTARWDDTEDDDFNWRFEAQKVGNLILDENPNLLLMVEGIETYPKEGHKYGDLGGDAYYGGWWGGNLAGVKDYPIDMGTEERNNKIVYAPHDYGPSVSTQTWFDKDFTVETLKQDIWERSWLYIHEDNIAPVLIGEWGGRFDVAGTKEWMQCLAKLITDNNLNHTFWCLNSNSWDTGGIYVGEFEKFDDEKYDVIKSTLWQTDEGQCIGLDHQINLGATGTHVPAGKIEKVTLGDINGDGVIDILDYTLFRKYFNAGGEKGNIKIHTENADVNKDGEVNFFDLVALKDLI